MFIFLMMGSVLLKMFNQEWERSGKIMGVKQWWMMVNTKQAITIFGMRKSSIHDTNNIYGDEVLLFYKGSWIEISPMLLHALCQCKTKILPCFAPFICPYLVPSFNSSSLESCPESETGIKSTHCCLLANTPVRHSACFSLANIVCQ